MRLMKMVRYLHAQIMVSCLDILINSYDYCWSIFIAYSTFKNIYEHRQLIKPSLTQKAAPLCDTIIVVELATHVKIVILVDIGLQVLRISIHRTELEYIELLAVFPYPSQPDEHPVCMLFHTRLTFLLCNHAITVVNILLADHLKTAVIQPAQHFGTREHFFHLFRAEIVKTACQP